MKRALLISTLLLLLLGGCSTVKFSARRAIESIEQIQYLPTDTFFTKALYDPLGNTIYAMDTRSAMVYVYRDGKLANRIGGIGFENYNFQRLSDIALDADGGLLALDGMARTLKKFNPDGQLTSRMDLSKLTQPELVATTQDRDLFVFDAAPQEIVCLSAMDGTEQYRFGKFQSLMPTNLSCTRDYVVAYDLVKDATQVFHLLGEPKEEIARQIVYDNFANPILADLASKVGVSIAFPLPAKQKPGICTFNRDHLCAVAFGGIMVYKINYQKALP